jgi:hypothetical protein
MPETCYANPNPIYQPAMRIIAAITNSYPAVVTTTFAHQYVTGTVVRLMIMPGVGMQQANKLQGPIVVTGSTTFTMDIDTTYFDPFVIPDPAPATYTCSQVIAIAEVPEILSAATQNVLPFRS